MTENAAGPGAEGGTDQRTQSLKGLTVESLRDALEVGAWRSLLDLAIRPGLLTVTYLRGDRTRYARPVQIYLVAAALFFVVNSFLPFLTATSSVTPQGGLEVDILSYVAGVSVGHLQIDARKDAPPVDDAAVELYKERFRTAVTQSMAPFLVGCIFAFMLALWLFNPSAPPVTHGVFALHWIALFLMVIAVARFLPDAQTNWVSIPVNVVLLVHLVRSVRRVYGHGWARSVASGFGLLVLFFVILATWQWLLMSHAHALTGDIA